MAYAAVVLTYLRYEMYLQMDKPVPDVCYPFSGYNPGQPYSTRPDH